MVIVISMCALLALALVLLVARLVTLEVKLRSYVGMEQELNKIKERFGTEDNTQDFALLTESEPIGKISLSPQEIVVSDRDELLIQKIMAWLEENLSDASVTVDQLAQYVGMGRTSMYNKIKGLTGKSPVELIQEFRIERSTYYLKSGQYSVSETSYKVGFSDPGYFSRTFKKYFGMTPADYIKQNKP